MGGLTGLEERNADFRHGDIGIWGRKPSEEILLSGVSAWYQASGENPAFNGAIVTEEVGELELDVELDWSEKYSSQLIMLFRLSSVHGSGEVGGGGREDGGLAYCCAVSPGLECRHRQQDGG